VSISRDSNQFPRACLPLLVSIALSASMILGCRGSQTPPNSNRESSRSETITSSTPPFPTKEPERYQATRVIRTGESSPGSSDLSAVETRSSTTFIARDGDKRREEYHSRSGEKIVYLEIPPRRFVLLPANKTYADLDAVQGETEASNLQNEAEISPDRLIYEARPETHYQKLGIENLGGRTTTKYRVTLDQTANGNTVSSETLIWVDEALGMPIRSLTRETGHDHFSEVMTELKDISLDIDQGLFQLPKDYKRAEARLIFARVLGQEKLGTPKSEAR
jgi:hypothetical protein